MLVWDLKNEHIFLCPILQLVYSDHIYLQWIIGIYWYSPDCTSHIATNHLIIAVHTRGLHAFQRCMTCDNIHVCPLSATKDTPNCIHCDCVCVSCSLHGSQFPVLLPDHCLPPLSVDHWNGHLTAESSLEEAETGCNKKKKSALFRQRVLSNLN